MNSPWFARVQTHWSSEPEHDGCRERDGRQEGLGASIIADCDSALVFQATEHDLDAVVPAIASLVGADSLAA